jgi:hypothetical protein
MLDRSPIAAWFVCIVMGIFVFGCSESVPVDVAAGEFVAEVGGSVTDTLQGPVHYRMRDGHLVGLEMGTPDGAGVSVELDPRPLAPGAYTIVDGPLFGDEAEASEEAGAMAFLTTSDAEFTAARGTLTVERVQEETMAATFSFEMRGRMHRGGGDAGVQVQGRLRAPPSRE